MESFTTWLKKVAVRSMIALTVNAVCAYVLITLNNSGQLPKPIQYISYVALSILDLLIVYRFVQSGDLMLVGGFFGVLGIIAALIQNSVKHVVLQSIVVGLFMLSVAGFLEHIYQTNFANKEEARERQETTEKTQDAQWADPAEKEKRDDGSDRPA